MKISDQELAQRIDHTLLKPEAQEKDIIELCRQARHYRFMAVCVQPCFVELCARELSGSDVKIACVVGFPLGANCPEVKAYEAQKALAQGARELDMVQNIGALKEGKIKEVYQDIRGVVEAAALYPGALVKVIIETAQLTDEEKVIACQTAVSAGAHYVKTSTGFGGQGATIEDVQLMAKAVAGQAKVKASGGIKTREQAEAMLQAGADRIGTSSGASFFGPQ